MHKISARVIDAQTKEPLAYANVAAIDFQTKKVLDHNGRKLGTTTNEQGKFTLELPTLDYDDIAISYMGYKTLYLDPRTIQVTPVIALEPTAHTLAPVEITGTPRPKPAPVPEKRSIPEWFWALAIPAFFLVAYLIYKYLNHGKAGNAQPATKLR